MKIYFAHSRDYDYQSELYQPLRHCLELNQADLIFPHESAAQNRQTRDFYKTLDLVIAEVSHPATGMGIELGWAYDDGIPIVCISQQSAKISGSLHAITDQFYTYSTPDELIQIVKQILQSSK